MLYWGLNPGLSLPDDLLSQLHNLLLSVCCREYGVSLEALCYLPICLLRQDLTLGWPGIHRVSQGDLELMEILHPLLPKC